MSLRHAAAHFDDPAFRVLDAADVADAIQAFPNLPVFATRSEDRLQSGEYVLAVVRELLTVNTAMKLRLARLEGEQA